MLSALFNMNKVLLPFFICCLSIDTVFISKLSLLPQLKLIFLLSIDEILQKPEEIGLDNFTSKFCYKVDISVLSNLLVT